MCQWFQSRLKLNLKFIRYLRIDGISFKTFYQNLCLLALIGCNSTEDPADDRRIADQAVNYFRKCKGKDWLGRAHHPLDIRDNGLRLLIWNKMIHSVVSWEVIYGGAAYFPRG